MGGTALAVRELGRLPRLEVRGITAAGGVRRRRSLRWDAASKESNGGGGLQAEIKGKKKLTRDM
jgi:hypothetical protein